MERSYLKSQFILIVMLSLSAFLLNCGSGGGTGKSQVKGENTSAGETMQNGALADVHFNILTDGTLYATSIDVAQAGETDDDQGENEGDDSEIEDGDDAGDQGENEGDDSEVEDGDDEGDHQDDDQGDGSVEEFGGQVDAVSADFTYFVIFGTLMVYEEADKAGGDPEQSGDMGIADLTPGMWVEAEGAYGYTDPGETDGETNDGLDGVFYAASIRALDAQENSIDSLIENLTGTSFTMLGLTITYDANTVMNPEENDDNEK